MSFIKTGWLIPLLVAIPAAWADSPAKQSILTLNQAESLALANNPALHSAESSATAMAAIPPQVGSLPDPVLSLNALNLPVDSFSATQVEMTQMQIGLSQTLPFPGKLALKEERATRLAEAAASNRDESRIQLLRNVRIHWWNLAYLDKALMLVRHNQALLRNLVRVSEAKYKTGNGLQQDVLLAGLELSRLLEREMALQSERAAQAAALNALLGRDPALPIILPEEMPDLLAEAPDAAALKQRARENRPLLRELRQRMDAAESMVALAEKDYYPDFGIGVAYGFRQGANPASRQSRADLASIMLSMNLPLYTDSKQDRAVDQRKAEQMRAQFDWQDALWRVHAEIEAAAADLRIAHGQLSLFKQGIIPQARQTTASMLAGYQVNKVDFLNLVRAQLAEFNNDIQYWQLRAKAAQAEARLAAAAGQETLNQERAHHE